MLKTIVIVGRPNVGKSTLFNRLVGSRQAIVAGTPGVTRDWREGVANLSNLEFRIVDTAGLEATLENSVQEQIRQNTEVAISQSDAIIFLYDARVGVTPFDEYFADWIRCFKVPVILVANKCEGTVGAGGISEGYAMGFGDPVAISAEHNEGLAELYEPILDKVSGDELSESLSESNEPTVLRLAIVGRPNVGKSTLINRLLGKERLLTGPESGLTRDAIAVDWFYNDQTIRLFDTAGLRRSTRVLDDMERLSVADAERAIRFAHVVILVLDANKMLERQDLTIARKTIIEGRGLVIAVNKWDIVSDREAGLQNLRDKLVTSLPQVRGVPFVTISALKGQNLDELLEDVLRIYAVWKKRVPTGKLNAWLGSVTYDHPPPMSKGRRVRLRYITQIKTGPPTFAIWASRPDSISNSYVRFLSNRLRVDFAFFGTPLRLQLRKGKNPYDTG